MPEKSYSLIIGNVMFSIRKLIEKYSQVKHDISEESNDLSKRIRNDKKRPNPPENLQNISELGEKISKDAHGVPNPTCGVCSFCRCEIKANGVQANWKWNLQPNTLLCAECYTKKGNEYEKIINFCNSCQKKLGFIRYNPKPIWKMSGQMCRKCWDSKNTSEQSKSEVKK